MSRIRRLLLGAASAAAGLAAAILLLRVTIADLTPVSAWVFYFVPLPLVAGVLAVAALLSAVALAARATLAAALAALALSAYWLATHTFDRPCDESGERLVRVVAWNVNDLRRGAEALAAQLAAADADVIGLVEASHPSESHLAFWRERFPEHDVLLPGSGLVLIVRGTIVASSMRELIGISRVLTAEIEVHGTPLRVVLADLDASPRFDKQQLIGRTFDAAAGEPPLPTIVFGDFNTPIESRWFRDVRRRYVHAFEQAGAGLLASWPATRPLLAIDHVWVGEGLAPTCARLEPTVLSDHLLFRATLRFAPTQRSAPRPL
jgi:endonuclease/exonuclease/phosphatase (EEP) superfamily protein YafD